MMSDTKEVDARWEGGCAYRTNKDTGDQENGQRPIVKTGIRYTARVM